MTSARSLRLLSNGSNWCFTLALFLFLISCSSTTTSSARTKVIKPEKKVVEVEEVIIPVDTIAWTVVSEDEFPPIETTAKVASYGLERVEKDEYRIALLLPMKIKQDIPSLDAINRKFADFYAGIKMAAQSDHDVRAQVDVYYTDREEGKLDQILSELQFNLPDVIIASYSSNLIKKTAAFGAANRIPVISPWKSSTTIASANVFYLQMRPSIEHYYKRIIEHVSQNYLKEEVRIVQRLDGSDRSKTRLLHKVQEEISELPINKPYEVFDVELDSLMNAEASVFDTALVQDVKAFIVPHYNSTDESFVYTCLRKMYGEKLGRDFQVYTMPVALNSERIDINLLKNLSVRTAEFRFPNKENTEVQEFRKSFFETNGLLPQEDAYYGYDLMSFILQGLSSNGQYFHYFMAGEDIDLMQMNIHIQPFYKSEDKDYPDFMVNDHLYIIEYVDDHFEVKDIR